jgi:hypothetical protein
MIEYVSKAVVKRLDFGDHGNNRDAALNNFRKLCKYACNQQREWSREREREI